MGDSSWVSGYKSLEKTNVKRLRSVGGEKLVKSAKESKRK